MIESLCVAVSRREAEDARRKLAEKHLLRTDLKIISDERYVYIPVSGEVDIESAVMKKMYFEKIERRESFRDAIKKFLGEAKISSFDTVGDIAIVRIPPELKEHESEIGNAILSTHKSIKVVCADDGVKDDYRIRNVRVIAGENRTETTHVEYGARIRLDISKVYYSPRLATERYRVAKCVKEGERVIDMFAGVAPFSILIAKLSKPSRVYAIDINPHAVEYARLNSRENRVDDIIEVIEGDAREVVPSLEKADHVIMNLPHSSHEFFSLAVNAGSNIHYYEIIEKDKVKDRIENLKNEAIEEGKKADVKNWRIIGGYSPSKVKIGVDFIIR
ncbi:MAG: class I SAM-dependent methyltransferase family protein [Thermoplasmata archaeon]|nr:MAG: class I SAM-dependent methyltransferase family protein [Thermoplasmata archaeon]